jgi:hypothetical protein
MKNENNIYICETFDFIILFHNFISTNKFVDIYFIFTLTTNWSASVLAVYGTQIFFIVIKKRRLIIVSNILSPRFVLKG